jgi:hypothetical protein
MKNICPLPQCCILLIRMASAFCNRSTLDQKLTFRTLMRIFRKPVTMHNFVPCGYLESSQFDHSMSVSELKYLTTESSQNFPSHDPRTKGIPSSLGFQVSIKDCCWENSLGPEFVWGHVPPGSQCSESARAHPAIGASHEFPLIRSVPLTHLPHHRT